MSLFVTPPLYSSSRALHAALTPSIARCFDTTQAPLACLLYKCGTTLLARVVIRESKKDNLCMHAGCCAAAAVSRRRRRLSHHTASQKTVTSTSVVEFSLAQGACGRVGWRGFGAWSRVKGCMWMREALMTQLRAHAYGRMPTTNNTAPRTTAPSACRRSCRPSACTSPRAAPRPPSATGCTSRRT